MSADLEQVIAQSSKKKRSKTKFNILAGEAEDEGFSTDEFSDNYCEKEEPKSVLLPNKRKPPNRNISRGLSSISLLTSLNQSKTDHEKAAQTFDENQKKKQDIMDLCEKRAQDLQQLMKKTQGNQSEYEAIYKEHDDLNSAVQKVITRGEIMHKIHNLPSLQKILDETEFGLKNDEENLQGQSQLDKFRQAN